MTTTPTLLDFCRQFDAAYVPGFNERFAAALENKTDLSPEDAACLETRIRIGKEIEPRLGPLRDEFESRLASWPERTAAVDALLYMAKDAARSLERAMANHASDATRLLRDLGEGGIFEAIDIPMALAHSGVIFATDDKARPLIDKLRVLLS